VRTTVHEPSRTAAIVLAAGFSRRLGRPKQAVIFEGEMLVLRAARIAAQAGFSPVFVVVSAAAYFREALEAADAHCLENAEAVEGIASSIRCGVQAAQHARATGAVLMTCDQPHVSVEHLQHLTVEANAVTASSYAGRKGIPAYFPAGMFEALLRLRGDAGAREFLRDANSIADEALAVDVDIVEDLATLRDHEGLRATSAEKAKDFNHRT
jgi:molybdenum cofactor cytidylyltransferase